jgi:hypothetical protein
MEVDSLPKDTAEIETGMAEKSSPALLINCEA